MYAVAAKVQELDYLTHLNIEFQSDLHWWNTFLGHCNGVSFFQPKVTPDIGGGCLWFMGLCSCLWMPLVTMGVASRVEKRNDYGEGVGPYCFELCCMGKGNGTKSHFIPV